MTFTTMEVHWFAVGLNLMIMSSFFCGTVSQAGHSREDLIQDSVRRLLGLKSSADGATVPGKVQSLPPRYMMDLYEKYRSGQAPMQGNTVRSILAMRDTIDEVNMLIFNLTGINYSEQILQSKLYILKRRKPKIGRKRDSATFRLKVGCLPQMTSQRFIDISLSRQKSEWHSYDISESVMSCRQSKKKGDYLLGLTLEIKRPKGNYRLSSFRRLIKPNSQPFVLIFSEDSQNRSQNQTKSVPASIYEEIGDLLRAKADQEASLPEGYFQDQEAFPEDLLVTRKKRFVNFTISKDGKEAEGIANGEHIPLQFHLLKSLLEYPSEGNMPEVIHERNIFKLDKHRHSDVVNTLRSIINAVRYSLHVNTLKSTSLNKLENRHHALNRKQNQGLNSDILSSHSSKSVQLSSFSTQKSQDNFHEHSNIARGTAIETRVDDSTESLRLKRSIPNTLQYSTLMKESGDPDATDNTIQVIEEKYVHRSNPDTLPIPRRRNRHRTESKSPRKHKKKKRRRNRKLPFWWTRHDNRLHSQDLGKLCQRKSLMVDFSQMGWDDWIISPKSFNAHYCAGGCSFPLIKDAKPSNHAAIQSLIHAIGLNPNIPTPCCVPSVTSSLTLLYFDENGGLVLKNYPNMIVDKCACR